MCVAQCDFLAKFGKKLSLLKEDVWRASSSKENRESVVIAATGDMHELLRVSVIDVCGGKVKLGFKADNEVAIHREEVWERVRAEIQTSSPKKDND
jgi:carbon storage regulator CsrA